MSDPAYVVVQALYHRLAGNADVLALVPAGNIVDRSGGVPTVFPCILLGEGQIVDEGASIARKVARVFATLHLWTADPDLTSVKHIGAAVRTAIRADRFPLSGGHHCADLRIDDTRYIRDASGEHGHGIMTINALVGEP